MLEISLHGRGGQGVVVAGEILANAYFMEGYETQFMPSYGAERRGSPSNAYVRVDTKPILKRYTIDIPDIVVVFNAGLINTIKLKPGGIALINTCERVERLSDAAKLFVVEANKIAISLKLGSEASPIANTALLGAFSKIVENLSLDNIAQAILKKLEKNAETNIKAAKIAYRSVRKI